jgi:uncharacterized protein YdeI (YjbR/CyaY-like superfamily)
MSLGSIEVASGVVHEVPVDMQQALCEKEFVLQRWNKLTPLQRNEWICWVTIVKKETTRVSHIQQLVEEISNGKKSPCCWPGCPHRRPSAEKWFKKKQQM